MRERIKKIINNFIQCMTPPFTRNEEYTHTHTKKMKLVKILNVETNHLHITEALNAN